MKKVSKGQSKNFINLLFWQSNMRIDYSHNLEREEAYQRISNLLLDLQRQYADKISNPKARWNQEHSQMDFSMEIMGFSTSGQVYLKIR